MKSVFFLCLSCTYVFCLINARDKTPTSKSRRASEETRTANNGSCTQLCYPCDPYYGCTPCGPCRQTAVVQSHQPTAPPEGPHKTTKSLCKNGNCHPRNDFAMNQDPTRSNPVRPDQIQPNQSPPTTNSSNQNGNFSNNHCRQYVRSDGIHCTECIQHTSQGMRSQTKCQDPARPISGQTYFLDSPHLQNLPQDSDLAKVLAHPFMQSRFQSRQPN